MEGQDTARLLSILSALGYKCNLRTALGGGDGADCLRNLRHTFITCEASTGGEGLPPLPRAVAMSTKRIITCGGIMGLRRRGIQHHSYCSQDSSATKRNKHSYGRAAANYFPSQSLLHAGPYYAVRCVLLEPLFSFGDASAVQWDCYMD